MSTGREKPIILSHMLVPNAALTTFFLLGIAIIFIHVIRIDCVRVLPEGILCMNNNE